jgi:hypothetical protein
MDLKHIYSVINYEYEGLTDERTAPAVDHQGRLNHHLPPSDQPGALQISFRITEGRLCTLLDVSSPAEHCSKATALHGLPF